MVRVEEFREKPLLIYDGRCSFCKIWVRYWQRLTGPRIEYATSQEMAGRLASLPPAAFEQSIQLVQPDGTVLSGARAVFEALRETPGGGPLWWSYENVPLFAPLAEFLYRAAARHRTFFYWITRLLFGVEIYPATFARIEWLFLRLIAIIYFIAFASLGVQVAGLIGPQGVLPAGQSNAWLQAGCITGCLLAVSLALGFFQRVCLALLYGLYLYFCTIGGEFLSYQWDYLLLETGFLSIFVGNSRIILLLYRWLLFRLMFSSGAVKLLSGDPAWRELRALEFHYYTQPLPTPLAWYMQQAPRLFQRFSTGAVFFVELLIPFLFFAPRRLRFCAAFCTIFLQCLILLTGNYTFFNWLAIALCLFLFDDRVLGRRPPESRLRASRPVVLALAVLILFLSVFRVNLPYGIVNTYGLFAVMTTTRLEIIIQGSDDGVAWKDYEFKYKPGDVHRAPPVVAPHQPRLDWQMWFAALGDASMNPWFGGLLTRILQGSGDTLTLLRFNPFAGKPPKYVRALIYEYWFTSAPERQRTGAWWRRELRGQYFPAVSLKPAR